MNRIIFATGNAGKMKEIREILGDMDAEILSMKEAGIQTDIVENGTTFEENARIKAKAVAQFTKDIVLADDSGLEVDYLNKEPGVYSARYMGEDTSYTIKNLQEVTGLDMTRFFMWMSLDVPLQSLRRNRKIRSATGERRCAP